MRVLLLHNRYRAEGGEERAVAQTAALLERRGHTVRVLERSSADLSRAQAAQALLSGGRDPDEIAQAVRALKAEIVHVHNPHPAFGWRALAAAQGAGARTVLHLHNFRLYCSIGVAFRDGAPCHQCRGRNTLPGLVHRCRGSAAESAVYTAGLCRQQPRLLQHSDRLVVNSQAHGGLLRAHGVPWPKVSVVPHFATDLRANSRADQGRYALVSGRLVEEKGFDTAVAAARSAGVPLVVAGAGPEEKRLRALAGTGDVRFTGWLEPGELARVRGRAAVLLAPSRCEESFGYSVLEAMADGLPVLVSDRGALPEMAPRPEDVLPAEDPDAWATALGVLWRDEQGRRSHGEAALEKARTAFGEERAYRSLMDVYGCEP